MHHEINEAARQMRVQMLEACDLGRASRAAELITNANIDRLNNAGLDVGEHMVAQALIARAHLQVAADWVVDLHPHVRRPDAWAALLDIAVNIPPELEGLSIDTRAGEEKR